MITVKNLSFSYLKGEPVLKNVSLKIETGDKVGIIGQNGAGKTSLVKQFNNLLKPLSGSVVINGTDTKGKTIAELSKLIGFVFQNPNDQIFNSTLEDEVSFGLKQLGINKSKIKQIVKEYLTLVDLWDKRRIHPSNLNYADRKLLSIASILAMNPPILVFDEPTTGQDYTGNQRIIELINNLKDKTVIIISHDMSVVAETCNKIVVMSKGEILIYDDSLKVFSKKDVLLKAFVHPPEIITVCEELGIAPVLKEKELLKNINLTTNYQ